MTSCHRLCPQQPTREMSIAKIVCVHVSWTLDQVLSLLIPGCATFQTHLAISEPLFLSQLKQTQALLGSDSLFIWVQISALPNHYNHLST